LEGVLEKLYTMYEQKMYRLAYAIVQNEAQAEDVVQESFAKIFSNLEKIKNVESMDTKRWIVRIVKNEAINHYRGTKRRWNLENKLKAEQNQLEYDNVEDKAQQMIKEEYLQVIFDELPMKDKQILQYRLFYELSTAETADMLRISEDGVRKRFMRAKQKVKELTGGSNDEQ